MELEDIVLNEMSQAWEDKYCTFSFVETKMLMLWKLTAGQWSLEARKEGARGGVERSWLTMLRYRKTGRIGYPGLQHIG
jgi:hypothetical protein